MSETFYGKIKEGNSKYTVVAPHGITEERTIEISELLSDYLECSAILNTKIHRDNCNFNDISDLTTNRLKQQFYSDLTTLLLPENSVILYIHGMCDKKDIAVDLGFGVRWDKITKEYQTAKQHPINWNNKGKRTADIRKSINFRKHLSKELKNDGKGRAFIGRRYAAWHQHTGTQYFADSPHQAIQIEICETLRYNPKYIADKLSEALVNCF